MTASEGARAWVLWSVLALGAGHVGSAQAPAPAESTATPAESTTTQTAEQLQQLVAPIALYPDALVAQILAAATYPVQVVEAERWMQERTDLPPADVAAAADSETWDPSVKALTGFPAILAMLDTNLAWTSALGDAYASQPQDVMSAVQTLRQQARDAGHLASTPQETVSSDSDGITIAPAEPDVVYVPEYNPCTIYGEPIVVYPRWDCGVFPVGIAFGIGVPIGWWPSAWGWGWRSWGFDWHRRTLLYRRGAYVTRSNAFVGRVRGGSLVGPGRGFVGRPAPGGRVGGMRPVPRSPTGPVERGFGQGRAQTGTRSGAFTGFGPGGGARSAAARGRSSSGGGGRAGGTRGGGGGGGGTRGGGGGAHGGGGHR
jgi:hypothetical protein